MKKRKILIGILLALCISAFSLGIIGCNKTPSGFRVTDLATSMQVLTATDEEVTLGNVYETATSISDSGRNFTVTNVYVYRISDGKRVYTIGGEFDVLNTLGYEIEYHCIENGVDFVKKHTLSVIDLSNPLISIQQKRIATVGTRYEYPEISVRDDSGEKITPSIKVVNLSAVNDDVTYDASGFTPTQVGYYQLQITATDSSGNVGTASYDLFARTGLIANEIDSFDDDGLVYTSYTKSGKIKGEVGFSSFSRISGSKGSAYFTSGTGDTTAFYFEPRTTASVMNDYGANASISVWLYIASSVNESKTIKFGALGSKTVNTNEWSQITISSADVGMYSTYFGGLKLGSNSLFEIVNEGSDYIAFVDSVLVTDGGQISVSGLNDTYDVNATVSFTTDATVSASYYYAGKNYPITGNSFAADKSGEYIVNVYTANGVRNYSKKITVGNLIAQFTEYPWFTAGETISAPNYELKENAVKVTADTTTLYQIDNKTGEEEVVSQLTAPDDNLVSFRLELTYSGKTVSLFSLSPVHEHSPDVWSVVDEKSIDGFNNNVEFDYEYLDEFDGEDGVVAIKGVNQGVDENSWYYTNNRKFWSALYTKSHYSAYDKLVIRMKASVPNVQLGLIGEGDGGAWADGVLMFASNIATDKWVDYTISLEKVLNNFDVYANSSMFLIKSSEHANYTVYISEIRVIKHEVPAGTMLDFTDSAEATVWASDSTATHLLEYADAQGVAKLSVPNAMGDWNSPKWWGASELTGANSFTPVLNASDYEGSTKLNFRMRVEGDGAIDLRFFIGWGKEGYITPLYNGGATDGWTIISIDVPSAYDFGRFAFVFVTTGAVDVYMDRILAVNPDDFLMVTFDTNNGKTAQEIGVLPGDTVSPIAKVYRNGCTFVGWMLDSEDGEPFDFNTPINANTTLVAKWTKTAGVLNDFVDPATATVSYTAGTLTHLATYEGAQGVLKLSVSNATGNYNDQLKFVGGDTPMLTAAYAPSEYAGTTKLNFRVRVEGAGSIDFRFFIGWGFGDSYTQVYNAGATDGWATVSIDIPTNYSFGNFSIGFATTGAVDLYIDAITVS